MACAALAGGIPPAAGHGLGREDLRWHRLGRHLICKCSAGPVAACAALAAGVPPAAGHGPGREDFNKGISQRRMTRTCDEAFPKLCN